MFIDAIILYVFELLNMFENEKVDEDVNSVVASKSFDGVNVIELAKCFAEVNDNDLVNWFDRENELDDVNLVDFVNKGVCVNELHMCFIKGFRSREY